MDFGDYVRIEQKRYGVKNETYLHKVIKRFHSNTWVDVPVQSPATETLHDEIIEVVSCICCGAEDEKVLKYRLVDVKPESIGENRFMLLNQDKDKVSDLEKFASQICDIVWGGENGWVGKTEDLANAVRILVGKSLITQHEKLVFCSTPTPDSEHEKTKAGE